MKKEFFPIGTVVNVYKEAFVEYFDKNKRKVIFKDCLPPVVGVIVGGTYICEGTGHYGREYDPSYLSVSKKVFVYLVRKGFINKPMKVLPQDLIFTFTSVRTLDNFPFFYSNQPPYSEKDKRFLRHLMSTIPRDAKGRWLK